MYLIIVHYQVYKSSDQSLAVGRRKE
jgi:hypothetical protein